MVWFGHSSYLLQAGGRRILVDPVFCCAAPVSFVNRPFAGTDAWTPDDMPAVDCLLITHDHWDHLDYRTVMRLKGRTARVVCPLGVGNISNTGDSIRRASWSSTGTSRPSSKRG